jgi:hypothetical protein
VGATIDELVVDDVHAAAAARMKAAIVNRIRATISAKQSICRGAAVQFARNHATTGKGRVNLEDAD